VRDEQEGTGGMTDDKHDDGLGACRGIFLGLVLTGTAFATVTSVILAYIAQK
jgi:hypothetical protein